MVNCKKCMVKEQTSDVIRGLGITKNITVCKFCYYLNTSKPIFNKNIFTLSI
jgi:hypothetical protein